MWSALLWMGLSLAADDADWSPEPANRLYYTNASFARVNPLGLVDFYRLGWRHRLSSSDSTLLKDTYTFVAGEVMATPAYTRVGIFAEAQFLAIARVYVQYSGVGYYGNFAQIQSWDTNGVRYSDQSLEATEGEAYATLGSVFTTGGTLRAKAGNVVIRSTVALTRFDLNLQDGDVVFYDQYWDRLAPDGGWMVLNDADVLALMGKARVGVRHTFNDELGNSGPQDSALANHRVGPLLAWEFAAKDPGARYNHPTAFLVTQWWLQHPYRAGAEQPQGLPMIALGFAFNGDLATSK